MKNTAKTALERLAWVHIAKAKRKARMEAIRPIHRPNLARMYHTKAVS